LRAPRSSRGLAGRRSLVVICAPASRPLSRVSALSSRRARSAVVRMIRQRGDGASRRMTEIQPDIPEPPIPEPSPSPPPIEYPPIGDPPPEGPEVPIDDPQRVLDVDTPR
jgi:hypothetical protein